jgi:asparagine synthase (glutamine-hydrolysing)
MKFLIGGFGAEVSKLIEQHFTQTQDLVHVQSRDGLFYTVADGNRQAETITMGNGEGLLLGNIFDKETYASINTFHRSLQPVALMNKYWGRYSGALYNPTSKKLSLVRDPLGLETLYYMQYQNGILFSSCLPTLIDILSIKPSIDWHYFAEFLLEKNYLVPQTPFENVHELLPGIHLISDLNGNIEQTFEWHIPTDKLTDEKEIEEKLLDVLIKSTKAWVSNHEKISLQLSGGVDSSSILCLLKHIAPQVYIQGIHYNDSKNPASQEIGYAKQISEDCNIPLFELDFQDSQLFYPLPHSWRPDKPSTGMTNYNSVEQLKNIMGDSLLLSGQGGDHVFLVPPPQESIADYWLENGLMGISDITHELSSIFRTSWIALAKTTIKALKNYYLGKESVFSSYEIDYTMLNQKFVSIVRSQPFYLESNLKNFHPAKALHIKMLYHAVAYADSFDNSNVIYPLLSLPVVECGLQIPTYRSIKDGYNRYYFRKAISKINATKVIWRRNKGEVSASLIKGLQKEFATLETFLNEGLLLKNKVLDAQWLENRLNKIRHGDARDLIPLFRVIGAERWFAQWQLN